MSDTNSAYVALILTRAEDAPDATAFLKSARLSLARNDADSGQAPKVSTPRLRTAADTLDLRLTVEDVADGAHRVMIRALAYKQAPFNPGRAAQVLSDTALDIIETADVASVEWDDPDVRLEAEDFIRLRRYVSPRRSKPQTGALNAAGSPARTAAEPDADPTESTAVSGVADVNHDADARRLIRRFMQEVPDADMPRRTTAKPSPAEKPKSAATGEPTRKTSAAPDTKVAISAKVRRFVAKARRLGLVLHRVRKMNFRFATHVFAVSALFAILFSTDRLSDIMQRLVQ